MERKRVELEISDIAIDDAKEAYINGRGVTGTDVREVLLNQPRGFIVRGDGRIRYNLLGPNRAGRSFLSPSLTSRAAGGGSSALTG